MALWNAVDIMSINMTFHKEEFETNLLNVESGPKAFSLIFGNVSFVHDYHQHIIVLDPKSLVCLGE